MKKATLMKSAHRLAKELVPFTENYSIALSFALKEVWRQVKLYDKKRFGEVAIINAASRMTTPKHADDVFGVPDWILSKNLDNDEYYAVTSCANEMNVERETEKAELVSFSTDYGHVTVWVPKSVLVAA